MQSRSLGYRVWDLEFDVLRLVFKFRRLCFGIWEFRILSLKFWVSDFEYGVWRLEFLSLGFQF